MSRDDILGRVRNAIARNTDARPRYPAPGDQVRPARSEVEGAAAVALFIEMAEEAAATVERISTMGDVPDAVARYLSAHNQPAEIVLSPEAGLNACDWGALPTLTVHRRAVSADDATAVTGADAGIAETGSLMVRSGKDRQNLLYFLPDTHIAILPVSAVVGSYEDALSQIPGGADAPADAPRAVTLVTGPSRTSDIEKTLQIGIHGPRRLHILLVDEK